MDENTFMDIPEKNQIVFFGDGADKLRDVIKRKNVRFENFRISAEHMRIPALKALSENKFEDIAYFEPFYLKDFIATKPVKNILGNKMPCYYSLSGQVHKRLFRTSREKKSFTTSNMAF
jgi:tRNA threonylcarbamoyladenosine biosynthesis protein TsaB